MGVYSQKMAAANASLTPSQISRNANQKSHARRLTRLKQIHDDLAKKPKRSPQEQLYILDHRFIGVEGKAKKERAKLQKLIDAQEITKQDEAFDKSEGRTVQWDKEQSKHLKARLASVKHKEKTKK